MENKYLTDMVIHEWKCNPYQNQPNYKQLVESTKSFVPLPTVEDLDHSVHKESQIVAHLGKLLKYVLPCYAYRRLLQSYTNVISILDRDLASSKNNSLTKVCRCCIE